MNNLTETKKQEIADRLGLTKPNKPKEVAEFQQRFEIYKDLVTEFRADRLTSWGNWDIVAKNTEAIDSIKRNLNVIEENAKILNNFGETIRLAVVAYEQAELKYERAIQTEAERPRQEFETARANFIEILEKEERSLKVRSTRANNKAWALPRESAERLNLEEQAKEMFDRLALVQWLVSEARYIKHEDGLIFTEQALLDHITANSYRADEILKALGQTA
jgi:hypothetical protein